MGDLEGFKPPVSMVCLRPSSHSYDSTVVLRFRDERRAELAKRIINEDPAHRSASRRGRLLIIGFSNAPYDEPYATLDEIGWRGKFEEYERYQEITVSLEIPAGATTEAMAVVLGPDKAALYEALSRLAKRLGVRRAAGKKVVSFRYRGEAIYQGEHKGKHLFRFGGRTLLVDKQGVEVKED